LAASGQNQQLAWFLNRNIPRSATNIRSAVSKSIAQAASKVATVEAVTEATGDGLGRGGDGAELKGGVTTYAFDWPAVSPPQETHAKVMMEAILRSILKDIRKFPD
jgi:hypothetical protein